MKRFFPGFVTGGLFCLLFGPVAASACLFQTEAEVDDLYGPPVAKPTVYSARHFVKKYEFEGLEIFVNFLNGKSQCESIRKSGKHRRFSEEEINLLLDSNEPADLHWQVVKEGDTRVWELKDTASASYDTVKTGSFLILKTHEFEMFDTVEKSDLEGRAARRL